MSAWVQDGMYYDGDGHLHVFPNELPEPNCPVCGEPIKWALDMHSFTTGSDHMLAHARCVWKPGAFKRERLRAKGNT